MSKTKSIPKIKCPKCGSIPSRIDEEWSGIGQSYDVDEKGNIYFSHNPQQMNPTFVFFAICSKCNHGWKIKGCNSLKEIEHWDEHKKDKDGWFCINKETNLYK